MPGEKRLIALLYKILSKMGSYDTHHFWRAEGSTHFELMRDTHMQARSQPQFPHPEWESQHSLLRLSYCKR